MEKHKIIVMLKPQAQKTAALAGQPAQAEQQYEVPQALLQRLIDLGAIVHDDGSLTLYSAPTIERTWRDAAEGAAYSSEYRCPDGKLDERPADAEAAIAATEAAVQAAREAGNAAMLARQAREAEREAKREAKAERERDERMEWIRQAPAGELIRWAGQRWVVRDERGRRRCEIEAAGRLAEAEAEAGRLNAQLASEAEAEAAERAAWIAEYGSPRLQRLLAEGIEHGAVYRDERLALERVGWRWGGNVLGDGEEPRNAPESALQLLDEARACEPTARLVYWVVEACCDGGDHYDDDPCPGYHDGWRGYAVTAEFLGRTIVYGGPPQE